MELDRRALSRIDRKLLAGLDEDETYRMVRVPVTPATWSTWRRYCQRAGISMGRAIMVLIEAELMGELGERPEERSDLASRAEEQLVAREAALEAREREVKAAEERLRRSDQQLRLWNREVEARARSANAESEVNQPSTRATTTKVGRNEPCPCGSGSKFKWCHGR